ncbi:hypothetical protein ACFVGN_41695, partial [Streptomyces sp. NPDC057757]|uniref:hypothetical protein n=1 Tax=Streptomyces sp. NPDC057757 TaxID=3346241 RepID=UPI0036B988AA
EDKTVANQEVCAAVHRHFSDTGTLPLFAMDDEPERICGSNWSSSGAHCGRGLSSTSPAGCSWRPSA